MPVLSLSKRPANIKSIAGMARSCTNHLSKVLDAQITSSYFVKPVHLWTKKSFLCAKLTE